MLGLPVCTRPRFDIHGSSDQIDQRVKDTLQATGSVYEILREPVSSLQPTHLLAQTQCKVCAVTLEDAQRYIQQDLQCHAQVVALEPNTLSDIWLDIRRIATACGVPESGDRLTQRLQQEIATISSQVKTSPRRQTVACIEWTKPIMAAGNWIPELVSLAGGCSVIGVAGDQSPYIEFAQIAKADPDVVVIMPCGYNLEQTRRETHWLTDLPGWLELKAASNQRVYLCDANQYMTRPGPRIVDSVRALAEMLHPDCFSPTLMHIAWEPL